MNAALTKQLLATTEAQLLAWMDAQTALAANTGVQSYTIDTGQTRQTVTRADIDKVNAMIDSLMNRCAVLQQRLTGAGNSIARPCW